MVEENFCPRCRCPLPAGTPPEACPKCLLKRGLDPNTAGYTQAQPHWTPPTAQDLTAAFAELEILECLGRGGMGVVYKARQPRLNRLVALKLLAPEREKDPAFAGRFEREAQALARLSRMFSGLMSR